MSSKELCFVRHDDVPDMEARGWKLSEGNLEGTHHGQYSVIMERPELAFITGHEPGIVDLNIGHQRIRLSRGCLENLLTDGLYQLIRWPGSLG